MDPKIAAWIFRTGGEIATNVVHLAMTHRPKETSAPSKEVTSSGPPSGTVEKAGKPSSTAVEKPDEATTQAQRQLPTTEQTIKQLENRLLDQLSQLEDDFMDGARIDSLPCDCCVKHCRKLRDTSRELLSMARKPVYNKVLTFAEAHMWGPDEVAKHPPEFFVAMVPELRILRKELGGTEPVNPAQKQVQEITTLAKQVRSGELSKDEAKAKIKLLLSEHTGST